MSLNLPALPPLPPYPSGSEATQEAILNWRELARLHTWHQELLQKEACSQAMQQSLPSLTASVDRIADAWDKMDVAIVEFAKAIKPGLPVSDVTLLLTSIIDAIRRP